MIPDLGGIGSVAVEESVREKARRKILEHDPNGQDIVEMLLGDDNGSAK